MNATMREALSTTEVPAFTPLPSAPPVPVLPDRWQCTALLHPYSPPPSNNPRPNTPFFQLCTATIGFIANDVCSIQVIGVDYGEWWYKITPRGGTTLSTDRGRTWTSVDMGWSMPTTRWLGNSPTYFSTSYLNWMQAQKVDWWKQPVPGSNATTWTWYDTNSKLPVRMMFGAPPPSPTRGDPNQLAFFQNFSFTYLPSFERTQNPNVNTWAPQPIAGFQPGNPSRQRLVVWAERFAMTTLMTPVDSASFPLPTIVFYQWKPSDLYKTTTDRSQLTFMSYENNPDEGFDDQVALLYGAAPRGVAPPPYSGNGYIYNQKTILVRGKPETFVIKCTDIHLGQEPPDWASIPAVQGKIHASVRDNAVLCPKQTVNIISVLFPPSNEYPQGRYLWTWYSPFPGSDGTSSRPVTFMESASTIAEGGTSLALADYFSYTPSVNWFSPALFELPKLCTVSTPDPDKGS